MNNFYKGGRELTYFKRILQSIYTLKNKCYEQRLARRYPIAHDIFKNNIVQATHNVFSLRLCYNEGSFTPLDSIVPGSGLDCHSFGYLLLNNQIISKETVIKQQIISKQCATQTLCRSLEEVKKQPRNGKESVMKHQANGSESAIKHQRNSRNTAIKYQVNGRETAINKQTKTLTDRSRIKKSTLFITKLTPTSKFLRIRFVSASSAVRVNSMNTRIALEVSWSKCRISAEERENKVGGILPAQYVRFIGNSSTLKTYMGRILSKISGFKALYFFSEVLLWFQVDNAFGRSKQQLNKEKARVKDDVSEYAEVKILKTVRVVLVLALTVSMFSLSAQERAGTTLLGHQIIPYEVQSEVDELREKGFDIDRFPIFRYQLNEKEIYKLKIGERIPEAIWNMPMAVLHRKDTVHTVRLSEYRNKDLIILDYWAHWCAPCIASMIKWEKLAKEHPDKIALVGVNLDYTYAALPFLKQRDWESLSIYGLDARVLNRSFFKSIMASRLVWIYKGKLYAITGTKSYEIEDVIRLINGESVDIKNAYDETY